MRTNKYLSVLLLILFSFFVVHCDDEENPEKQYEINLDGSIVAGPYIADYSVAKEGILRAIPQRYIDSARYYLHIAYQHTSHGTHVTNGLFGLQTYKNGDNVLFGVTNNNLTINKLDFNDYALQNYAAIGDDASDLSRNETAFIQATRNFLDDPDNAQINVVMWSWCSISGHNVNDNYLAGMQQLIGEYGKNGSKIGIGEGKRLMPVYFIFMTGHAETDNIGTGRPKNQADLIINFCKQNRQLCLDYYSIDTYDMSDNYWDDTNDDANSTKYGGNFYQDWQDSHDMGVYWFENRTPSGSVNYGSHLTQHITANRKAYAMWWILARIAGWDGESD